MFLLFDVNLYVPVHTMTLQLCSLRNVSVTKTLLSNNFDEFSCLSFFLSNVFSFYTEAPLALTGV